MIKRRHHYVWQEYLRSFADPEGMLYCLMNEDIKRLNTVDVAVQRDFYKLSELGPKEILFLEKAFVEGKNPMLSDLNSNWIRIFTYLHSVIAEFDKDSFPEELKSEIRKIEHNMSEDMHMNVENSGIAFMTRLRNHDLSFFDDPDVVVDFIYFFLMQYFRTKKIRDGIAQIRVGGDIDFSKLANILATVFATSAGMRLYGEREQWEVVGLENNGPVQFVTGDQPIVNLYASYGDSIPKPLSDNELELYYPITPEYAIIYKRRDSSIIDYSSVTEELVLTLNNKVVEVSHMQVYSKTRESLAGYLKPKMTKESN